MTEPRYVVGGHETFAFRTSWLKKGYDAVRQDRFAFGRDDAVVRLGVGKNMVRSIRFWCLATRVVEEDNDPLERSSLRASKIGDRLLADSGWDPYFEDPASLWLIHWLLVTNALRASAWWYIFARYPDNEFTKPRLNAFLQAAISRQQQTVSPASITRDVDCFLRTYVPSEHTTATVSEATFDCPLADLGLIRPADSDGVYRFHVGPKSGLPPHVVGYALIQFSLSHGPHRKTLGLREVLYSPGSPGQAFRLDENTLLAALDSLSGLTNNALEVTETAGVAQVYLKEGRKPALEELAMGLLEDYFRSGLNEN
ncbi:MAG: DUF4007 family protein [Acidobacteriota bacterium]